MVPMFPANEFRFFPVIRFRVPARAKTGAPAWGYVFIDFLEK